MDLPAPHPKERVVRIYAKCKGDARFVDCIEEDQRQLREICESCPVYKACREVADYLDANLRAESDRPTCTHLFFAGENYEQRLMRRNRKWTYNHDFVVSLREDGLSWANIADIIGCSKSSVQRCYKEHENDL